MPTKADIKRLSKPIKIKFRKGDQVMIISGKDKGQVGYIWAVAPKNQKAIVLKHNEENADQPLPLNAAVKHKKAKVQGEKSVRMRIPVPIHISNLMVLDPKSGKPTRVGRKREGDKTIRFAKKSGEAIPDAMVMEKES